LLVDADSQKQNIGKMNSNSWVDCILCDDERFWRKRGKKKSSHGKCFEIAFLQILFY